ncbi:MAG: lipoprotein-releasing ABC transporter permease subunit [Alphaproteobacteria bacterium]|nr:lipoprotein-releasing ABC transporter permease subunit [Alphaproteobacteria bacterium]
MSGRTIPFAAFEWMIAWRYLRARRREGGVSVMTVISLLGITLAVFALIATLAVRSGFRYEFVQTILGANAHITLYSSSYTDAQGRLTRAIKNYDELARKVAAVPGVTRAAPVVRGQLMASASGRNAGIEVFGERLSDLMTLPLIIHPESSSGDISKFEDGVAIGSGVAQELGVMAGDRIKIISPDGVKTAFGTAPRIKSYKVVYVFSVGRYDIDRTRVYMPLAEAQSYFNREGTADEIEISVENPDAVDNYVVPIIAAAGGRAVIWTWRDASGSFLRALKTEDNVMFIILSILVLIATMNIVSGLIMLVKNKGSDIGILRTMGLSEGSILRIFFIVGASIGVAGTVLGVISGSLFAIYIDPIFSFVNWMLGGGLWDPSVRYLSQLPARLELWDVLNAVILALVLSFGATIFPARRAARMNPVEALRYE